MLRNYLKIAFRNLVKNKLHSVLNITGLSVGLTVAIIIGLWVSDELSFNKYHEHYDSIAQVMQHQTINDEIRSQAELPIPVGEQLRTTYGNQFKRVVMSTKTEQHILRTGENKLVKTGRYMEADAPALFSLKVVKGSAAGLKDPSSILLSRSSAYDLFGDTDPVDKLIKLDEHIDLKVAGVYEDLPYNTTLNDLAFIAPWQLMPKLQNNLQNWGNNGWQIFVQMADNVDMSKASAKIKDVTLANAGNGDQRFKPAIFLQPMSKWYLYSAFKNGLNIGGGYNMYGYLA